MPLPADLVPPARGSADDELFFGARWAFRLCATLLILFALTVTLRWLLPAPPSRVETVVQQAVTPEISAAATRATSEVTAPDPDDTPAPGSP